MTVTLMAALLHVVDARADALDTPAFLFSGYGTVGLVHSTEDQADYTNTPYTKPNGAGYSHNWSADVDSRLGMQIAANLTPQVTAVLQAISQQNYDNTYTPSVEWANIQYAFTPDISVRLGRIAMPTFLVGDYRYVGYAVPWVRPPVELYGHMIPITNNDGVDASYRLHFGDATNTLQGSYGRDTIRSPGGDAPNVVKNGLGIFNTTEYGPATFHVAYQEADLTLNSTNPFFDLFRQFGPSGVALADKYVADNRRISFLSFGASYDPGKWFLMGEWGKGRFSSFIGTQTAWYASSGYRFGKFTPYVTFSQSEKLSNTSDPGLNLAALPPFLAGSASGLNAELNSLLSPVTGTTISIGSRWDVVKNVDLKLQFDHIHLEDNSSGGLINLQPGFQAGGNFNVFSAIVDFVF